MIDGVYAIDYQVHSVRSHDGRCTIREQCLRAMELGLDEIGFSEHKDFDPFDPVVDHFDYGLYAREIDAARSEFGGRLRVRMGVEIDYQRWFEDKIAVYLENHAFDFVIASVHYVDRRTVMTPGFIRGRAAQACYEEYYRAVRDSVECGLHDIVGHLEYANKRGVPAFGPFDPTPYREQVSELFDLMIERNAALEINTAGLRQGAGATYPCAKHVALYAERGGRLLTIGSDAHHPDDLASDYGTAVTIARRCGLTELTTYEGRRPGRAVLPGRVAPRQSSG